MSCVTNVTFGATDCTHLWGMLVAGYVACVLIGLSLGLVGGGGSILTVPVLVYLFGIDAMQATYSSIITVLLVRHYLVPLIPGILFSAGSMVVTKQMATMVLFALLMIAASVSMIRGRKEEVAEPPKGRSVLARLVMAGIGIGTVTGLLGAGGGFLLIPAMVLLLQLPMKKAVGTSLLIIALNSMAGFVGDIGTIHTDWTFLLPVTGIAVGGIVAGTILATKIPGERLKKGFGWFVLTMGIFILIKEVLLA
jgi:uncharacterized membrane protein YfcA